MSHLLAGANSSTQWYRPFYPGAEFFTHLDKFCAHTTETEGWPSYGVNGEKAPNATYHPRLRSTRQHFYSDRSSRALRDPADTPVRENRDNIFQLEIVAYSCYDCALSVGGLWIGDLTDEHYADLAEIIQELHDDLELPIQESVQWHEGRKTAFDDVRLTSSQFDSYKGILGHCHVSGNTHWDPGGFYISKLMATLEGEDVTDAEMEQLLDKMWERNVRVGAAWEKFGEAVGRSRAALREVSTQQLASEHLALSGKVDALSTKVDGIATGEIDYDLLAEKVTAKLSESLELGFRPNTPPVV